jgi:hypothetical protein
MGQESVRGPMMFAATTVMKTPPTRVGRISKDITLPRAIELSKLLASGAGVIFGMMIAAAIGSSLDSLLWGAIVGAGLGYAVVTYSPLKGESLWTWIGLEARSRGNRVVVRPGVIGRVYVGIAPVPRPARGEHIRIVPGAVEIPSGSADRRGVLIVDGRRARVGRGYAPELIARTPSRVAHDTWRAPKCHSSPSFALQDTAPTT